MTLILGLDPGESTGFGLISVEKSRIEVITYGVIPRLRPGVDGLMWSVRTWLEWAAPTFGLRGSDCDIAFEEAIDSYRVKTRREALEARGVIREWCATNKPVDSFPYTPMQVRLQLGLPLKGSVKKDMAWWVARALGYNPCGPDHVTDALGVALCHALVIGGWQAHIRLPDRGPVVSSKARMPQNAATAASGRQSQQDRMSAEEFKQKLARGDLVHTGGMSFREGRRL
jgi:Holliday junction resolvasome RuvABC endonuclease subunit